MNKITIPVPAEYKEILDIIAEIIAWDYLKTTEKDKGGKSHE